MSWGVTGLTVRLGDALALDAVSLEVPPGRVTAVVGGDGAGKSTLLRVLAGALSPTSGEVRRPTAAKIGYLSARSGTYPDLTVEENLAFSATAYGVPVAQARRRAAEYLERTGLASAADRLAGNLSGGMRQKLGVVRAMLHRPLLLVLDEPTTGVDPVSRADLWWLIARAAAENTAVVFTTAYLDEAERASWVLALDSGQPLAAGTTDAIVASVGGMISTTPDRPHGDVARRAWRRGASWRVWSPGPSAHGSADEAIAIRPDLQDAVTVASLRRELEGSSTGLGSP